MTCPGSLSHSDIRTPCEGSTVTEWRCLCYKLTCREDPRTCLYSLNAVFSNSVVSFAAGCEWMKRGPALVFEPRAVSPLVTWQDGRCNTGFLASLPKPASHLSVATGFGCATIFWLLKNRSDSCSLNQHAISGVRIDRESQSAFLYLLPCALSVAWHKVESQGSHLV